MSNDGANDPAKLTRIYIKMRDKKSEIESKARAEIERIEQQMTIVEKQLLDLLGSNERMANSYGTVSRVIKDRFWCADWIAFNQFVMEHADKGALNLFERRLAQDNTRQFLQRNPEAAIPGLQNDRRYSVRVRRASQPNDGE